MNSKEAFLALFEGKKMRRVQWTDKSIYLYLEKQVINCSKGSFFSDSVFNFYTNLVSLPNDIEWEEYVPVKLSWDWKVNDQFKFSQNPEEYKIVYVDDHFAIAKVKSDNLPWVILKCDYLNPYYYDSYCDIERICTFALQLLCSFDLLYSIFL